MKPRSFVSPTVHRPSHARPAACGSALLALAIAAACMITLLAGGCDKGDGASPSTTTENAATAPDAATTTVSGAARIEPPAGGSWGEAIYTSANLAGHEVSAENLGEESAGLADVAIQPGEGLGRVVSNVRERAGVFVNAIGHRKFIEKLPDGRPLTAGRFRYAAHVRLPSLPKPDTAQRANPQAVHVMVQFWDGRDALLPVDRHTLEGTIYWDLNPWTADECGKVKIYAYPLKLQDTGIRVRPDTEWHRFELDVDLGERQYVAVRVDGREVNLAGRRLAEVEHRDWGREVALIVTTESLAAWPGKQKATYTWATQFRDLSLWQWRPAD